MRVLHLTNTISDSDGVSMHVLQLMKSLTPFLEHQAIMTGKIDGCEKFREANIMIAVHPELLHSSRSIANFTNAVRIVRRFCKENNIDIIHSHSHYAANIADIVSKLRSVKTVQTIHGIIPDTGRLGHFKAHKFICVSEPGIERLLLEGIDRKRIKMIRQGIDHEKFSARKKFEEDNVTVLFASRIVNEKGPDIFLNAAQTAVRKFGNLNFVMAGIGDMMKEIVKSNNSSIIKASILGEVKNMEDLYSEADIFVMPGRVADEGFPMSIAEAAVSGCLIISSDIKALHHVFQDGVDGYTFMINDTKALAEKLIVAIEKKELSAMMADRFRKKAAKLFDVKKFANEHLKVYNE